VSRSDVRVCVKRDSGRWGERVDRSNVLEPQGVELQQMSALVLEGKEKTENLGGGGGRQTTTNTPAF